MKFNQDQLTNVDSRRVANAAMAVIDRLQVQYTPAEQLAGAAAVFLMFAERFGISAQEAFTVTKNVMNGVEGKRPEFAAVSDYLKHEVQ